MPDVQPNQQLNEVYDARLEKFGEREVWEWDADGSGNAQKEITLRGWIVLIKSKPNAGNPPDPGFDFKILDEDGDDVLEGLGEGLSDSLPVFIPEAGDGVAVLRYVNGRYTLDISGAGASTEGKIQIDLKNR